MRIAKKRIKLIVMSLAVIVPIALLSLFSGPVVYASGQNTSISCPTSPPPIPAGAARVVNIKFTAINDEDSGLNGYWAMDHLVENVQIFLLTNGSWYVQQTYNGQFMTVQGAISPGSASPTAETQASFGTVKGYVSGPFQSGGFSANGHPTTGNLGVVNMGGTTSDILKGTYGDGQTGGTNSSYFWYQFYFGGASPGSDPAPYYSLAYSLAAPFKPYQSNFMCQSNANNVQGDILL